MWRSSADTMKLSEGPKALTWSNGIDGDDAGHVDLRRRGEMKIIPSHKVYI